jgi:hypothetical protein
VTDTRTFEFGKIALLICSEIESVYIILKVIRDLVIGYIFCTVLSSRSVKLTPPSSAEVKDDRALSQHLSTFYGVVLNYFSARTT